MMERHDSLFEAPAGIELFAVKSTSDYAYITLLTRASYLAGVVLLAHTLRKQGSQYSLIVLYTPALTQAAIHALELETAQSGIVLHPCDLLIPPERHELNVAVERFTDTWTKLRVFQQYTCGFKTLCYLDADMILFKNMDTIFDHCLELPQNWIAAAHDCVCSPDKMPWTPKEHCKENCPLTPQTHPTALTKPMNVKPTSPPTHHLFNSGMFLFQPSQALWESVLHFFNTTELLGSFRFPDQDFMTHFFRNRWMPLSWKYNAVKTMAYRHLNIWRADEVVCLHLIVDKPWAMRIGADGIAGFKGEDGGTHRWWWNEYEKWFELRQQQGAFEVTAIMSKHVARRDSEQSDAGRPDMGEIGCQVHESYSCAEGDNDPKNEQMASTLQVVIAAPAS